MSLLLELGADASTEDLWDVDGDDLVYFAPLHVAAKAGQAGMVRLLLDAGACADRRAIRNVATREERYNGIYNMAPSVSALHLGAIKGHVDVIKEITKREPSIVNLVAECTGYTALHYAAKHRQLDAIDALVEAGADLEAEGSVGGGTALHIAAESAYCEAIVLALVGHGAKIDPVRDGNKTPLFAAVRRRNVCAAKVLVSAGADVREPLLLASTQRTSDETIVTLLGHGGDVNTKRESDGNTPPHLAPEYALISNVDVLLKEGADETAVSHEGQTPLDVVGSRESNNWEAWLDREEREESIRTLLVNAPSDRADRAWSRRGFALCRVFPERVRLQPALPSEDDGIIDAGSAASSASDVPSVRRDNAKRVATAEGRAGVEGRPAAEQVEMSAAAFRALMVRLMGLEADAVFRTIVEFV